MREAGSPDPGFLTRKQREQRDLRGIVNLFGRGGVVGLGITSTRADLNRYVQPR